MGRNILLAVITSLFSITTAVMAAPPISQLTRKLESPHPHERVRAIHGLAELGQNAAPAVPDLIKVLNSQDVGLQFEAVLALRQINSQLDQTIPALTGLLKAKDPILQHAAAESLRVLGPEAKSALPQLKELLRSKDVVVRVAAASAITSIAVDEQDRVSMDEAITVLVSALESPIAGQAVGGLVTAGKLAVPSLLKVLEGSHVHAMIHAEDALNGIAIDAEPAVAKLVENVDSENVELSWRAIRALGNIRTNPKLVVPKLATMLSSREPIIRIHAAEGLGHFGIDAVSVVDQLANALDDRNELVRMAAATSLGSIGPEAESAVPALLKGLDDPFGSVTIAAASALRRIGKPAVPGLITKLDDPHYEQLIATVLGQIGEDAADAAPAIWTLLKSPNSETHREAIVALAEIGPTAKPAVPDLAKLLDNNNFPHRAAVAYAVGRIGLSEAAGKLQQIAESSDDEILRLTSIWALFQLEPANDEYIRTLVPKLVTALDSQRPRVRREALLILAKLGPKANPALSGIRSAVKDSVFEVRVEALRALAEIGAASDVAVPDLIDCLDDGQPTLIRQMACHALGKIGNSARQAIQAIHRLTNQDAPERVVAAWALVMIEPNADHVNLAIPILIRALQSSQPDLKVEAARTLGRIGRGSSDSVAALKHATKDTEEGVRKAAEEALQNLTSKKSADPL